VFPGKNKVESSAFMSTIRNRIFSFERDVMETEAGVSPRKKKRENLFHPEKTRTARSSFCSAPSLGFVFPFIEIHSGACFFIARRKGP
jgi:hypothetical protein